MAKFSKHVCFPDCTIIFNQSALSFSIATNETTDLATIRKVAGAVGWSSSACCDLLSSNRSGRKQILLGMIILYPAKFYTLQFLYFTILKFAYYTINSTVILTWFGGLPPVIILVEYKMFLFYHVNKNCYE